MSSLHLSTAMVLVDPNLVASVLKQSILLSTRPNKAVVYPTFPGPPEIHQTAACSCGKPPPTMTTPTFSTCSTPPPSHVVVPVCGQPLFTYAKPSLVNHEIPLITHSLPALNKPLNNIFPGFIHYLTTINNSG